MFCMNLSLYLSPFGPNSYGHATPVVHELSIAKPRSKVAIAVICHSGRLIAFTLALGVVAFYLLNPHSASLLRSTCQSKQYIRLLSDLSSSSAPQVRHMHDLTLTLFFIRPLHVYQLVAGALKLCALIQTLCKCLWLYIT